MKKAQNLIEISLILLVVVVISLAVWPMINNQKMKLANLSASNLTQSGTINKARSEALQLATSMGLNISSDASLADVLKAISDKKAALEAAGADSNTLASFTSSYTAILNELGQAAIANDSSIKDQVNNLASSMGISVSSNDGIGNILNSISGQIAQISSSGSSTQAQGYIAQYTGILSVLTQPTAPNASVETTGSGGGGGGAAGGNNSGSTGSGLGELDATTIVPTNETPSITHTDVTASNAYSKLNSLHATSE